MNKELEGLEGIVKAELQPRVRKYKSDLDELKIQLNKLITKNFAAATNVQLIATQLNEVTPMPKNSLGIGNNLLQKRNKVSDIETLTTVIFS